VGRQLDPAELGPQPPHVRVERWIPQEELLPRCRAVVSQGGSGVVLGALAHGLPSVLLPVGADQPATAARCAELGAALVLDPVTATPETIRDAVGEVLRDPAYAAAAGAVRSEVLALPDASEAVGWLEGFASRARRDEDQSR
jgi:MGT family glycosyltransferase